MSALESTPTPAHGAGLLSTPEGSNGKASGGGGVRRTSHRYAALDADDFTHYEAYASPSQAKRALEAHLSETDRRLEEASRLGTALVQQRKDLTDRLKEVELKQGEGEIGPELRQKLLEVEREYNDLGRDSTRAFLAPKGGRQVSGSGEEGSNGNITLDSRNPASPTKFSSQAVDSPSKVKVPSRKQRNQPSSRVHDIEFATEISTSLLAQVRQLQAALAERDDQNKSLAREKSQLEEHNEGYMQRIKALDENEQRYKDENWALETQTHDLIAAAKEAASREQKLQQTLALATADKSTAQRELDDIKQAHGTLSDEHATLRKTHDTEIANLRKNAQHHETQREALNRRIEDLTSQNTELANAYAARPKAAETLQEGEELEEPETMALDKSDMEHSPPPSPSKGAVRNSALESETLRSSLHHAQRMIQTLKSNVHREKTERLELKRLLQESRDELEARRADGSIKRPKTATKDKKFPKLGQLGAGRTSRTDVEVVNDDDWEDHDPEPDTPRRITESKSIDDDEAPESSDAYQTANETEDAFETADERNIPGTATESEAFATTVEDQGDKDSSEGELTETENDPKRSGTVRAARSPNSAAALAAKRASMLSTASNSDGERQTTTPVKGTLGSIKNRLRFGRGSKRHQRMGSEEVGDSPRSSRDSPASFFSNKTPKGQSLAAELGEFHSGDEMEDTPSKSANASKRSTPARAAAAAAAGAVAGGVVGAVAADSDAPPVPKIPMVDSGMMTDEWEPLVVTKYVTRPVTPPPPPQVADAGVQRTPAKMTSTAVDADNGDLAAMFPSPPSKTAQEAGEIAEPEPKRKPELSLSRVSSISTEPLEIPDDRKSRPTTVIYSPSRSRKTGDAEKVAGGAAAGGVLGSVLGWATGKRQSQIEPTPEEEEEEFVRTQDGRAFKEISPNVRTRIRDSDASLGETVVRTRVRDYESKSQQDLTATPPKSQSVRNSFFETSPSPAPDRRPNSEVAPEVAPEPAPEVVAESGPEPVPVPVPAPVPVSLSDTGAQTELSASEIDALIEKSRVAAMPPPPSPRAVHISQAKIDSFGKVVIPPRSARRSGSFGSAHVRTGSMENPPPLPADHQQAIAAASQTNGKGKAPATGEGSMGPPIMPASAYRNAPGKRPITPNDQTPKAYQPPPQTPRSRYSAARSQRSRRSSISSFESELDARFNIRADGTPMPHMQGIDAVDMATPGGAADPRMIQAITQTMIGEYLWKYTRRAGRGDMSSKRHKRFFWIHPYTRTLYWSEQDPSTGGSAQMKAKSVAIEAVRVVADDNPMPPGLHRKSLLILTPGREIKFTAPTGQRHETWFNALSYLLLRSGGQTADGQHFDADDVAEFNPSLYSGQAAATGGRMSRTSLSSYNSRLTTRRTSRNVSPSRGDAGGSVRRMVAHVQPSAGGSNYASNAGSQTAIAGPSSNPNYGGNPNRYSDVMQAAGVASNGAAQPSSASLGQRLSSVWRPHRLSSSKQQPPNFAGEDGQHPGPIYDAAVVNDSAEDVRQVLERQDEEADKLENVRACCDGKHDVGSLNNRRSFGGRLVSAASRHSHGHGM